VPLYSGGLSLVALVQAFSHFLTDAIVNLHKWASASSPSGGCEHKHPKMTTAGLTCHQVLFSVDDPMVCVDFERCTCALNNFLSSQKLNLRVKSTIAAYGGWSLSINTVLSRLAWWSTIGPNLLLRLRPMSQHPSLT
jgi:hypothetical protein